MVLECLWEPPPKKYGRIFFTWINPWCFWVENFGQTICPNGAHSPTGTQIEYGYSYELGTRPLPAPGVKKNPSFPCLSLVFPYLLLGLRLGVWGLFVVAWRDESSFFFR